MAIVGRFVAVAVMVFSSWMLSDRAQAQAAGPKAAPAQVGIVSHVKVLSDKVEDVSSLEAWKKSYIKDGMSNEEKALAIWKTVVKYRTQTAPPDEYMQSEVNVHDVMKTINVYGYGMCCCAASNVEQLGRYIGFPAQGWSIAAHSVPELQYDGAWHMLDGSLIQYFRNPDKSIASVAEIVAAVQEWRKANPDAVKNLGGFQRNEGWKKGPPLLATSLYYDKDGVGMAGAHGWSSTMQEYDCKPFVYEYGYSQGYEVNVQLRPGERLTRNWFNKGLHVNMDGGEAPGCLGARAGMGQQRRFGDIAPGRVGNGTLEYTVPVADAALRFSALTYENLAAAGQFPLLHAADANKPGVLIIRMPTSYIYLTGEVTAKAVVAGQGGGITVSFSDNNGLDWKEVKKITESGDVKIDLKPFCFRRYDYRLKFEIAGAGTGLDALKITHDIQHSQAPLPALTAGKNIITFSADRQEGTITIEGSTNFNKAPGRQLTVKDFHPVLNEVKSQNLAMSGGRGDVTFTVSTPGAMTRLRFGAHYRARDARDGWDMMVSFDKGATWTKVDRLEGPAKGSCKYVTFEKVPAGTKEALVRYQGQQRNTSLLFDLRIDADYKEPFGGFKPVKVTYVWEEDGQEKRDVHVAKTATETYTITCAGAPLMKSIIVERDDTK